jgi:hypothetical protein
MNKQVLLYAILVLAVVHTILSLLVAQKSNKNELANERVTQFAVVSAVVNLVILALAAYHMSS